MEIMAKSGVDFRLFRERLIGYFQMRLLEACGVGGGTGGKLSVVQLEKLLQLLISAAKMETDSYIPQLPLQLVVVEFLEEKSSAPGEIKKIVVPDESTKEEKNLISEGKEKEVEMVNEEKSEQPSVGDFGVKNLKIDFGIDRVADDWGKVLMAVKPFNHSVEAFLRAVRPVKISGRSIVCEVFYPFHKDKLEEQKNRKIVEKGFISVFGVEMTFECVLAKSKLEPIVVKNDTPQEVVTPPANQASGDEMYDVAKQIFG
jgi:hypothetical protein